MSNNNNKMKGLLKGLRYISQIFENEKEQDMQIGFPTDVKHVAHIGWDGPSVNSPSWMNEFKSPPGFSSAPLSVEGEIKDDSSIKWLSEDSSRRSARSSPARDPELPRASRRHASIGSSAESPTAREKPEKPKLPRKSSKQSNRELTDGSKSKESSHEGDASPTRRPDVPKRSRRKKSKDSAEGSSRSSRSSSRRAHGSKSDAVSECGSVSKADINNCEQLNQTSEGGEDKESSGLGVS